MPLLLQSRREGMYLRFYPVGFDPEERGPRSMKEHVMHVINKVPGIPAADLGSRLGLSSGAIHHLATLLDRGLVKRFQLGRAYRYYPTEAFLRWHSVVPLWSPRAGCTIFLAGPQIPSGGSGPTLRT